MLSPLAKRCVELSYRYKLTHVSSVLNTVDLLARIYENKESSDIVVQDNGHAGLALYVVLESKGFCNAERMIQRHGVHPSRDQWHGIEVSSGSLGQASTVALGIALADKSRKVYLVTSDGACAEGCIWEVARLITRRVSNLIVHCVFNGYGAYGEIGLGDIPAEFEVHHVGQNYPEWLQGLQGHYLQLTKEQYEELMA